MVLTKQKPAKEPRSVTILGSTGSVGRNTVDLILRHPGDYVVEALTGNSNVPLLAEQARQLRPRLAVVANSDAYAALKDELSGSGIEVAAGPEALVDAASRPAEWVMAAIVGIAGLQPTLAAIRRGATVALANKECLVSAGAVMMGEVQRCGAVLLPVDSEHNAIFQVLDRSQVDHVEKIILTASGGPFREMGRDAMAKATCKQALAHPNWSMGAKISIDSATMMNKGLELIEAFHLFPVPEERIEILVHPQSVVHSLVAYEDGSVLAQLGSPDMRTPIAYTLAWPRRIATPAPRLSLHELGTLTFEAPDAERFPALNLARKALRLGGNAPTILNAANEEAVVSFLDERIGFLDIGEVVEETLAGIPSRPVRTLEDVFEADAAARESARRAVSNLSERP